MWRNYFKIGIPWSISKIKSDSITVLEKIGHFLDEEVQHLFNWYKPEGHSQQEINQLIFKNLDVCNVLNKAAKNLTEVL